MAFPPDDIAVQSQSGQAQLGQSQSGQGLVEAAYAPLLLYARQWDGEGAEDAVQVALLKFLQEFGTGRRPIPDNPIGWLFKVVRNERNHRFRKEKVRREHDRKYAETREAWFIPSPETTIDAQAAAESLRKLPMENREVIVAKIWGDLSFEEIAKLLGTSRSTAHRRYVEGLNELKNIVR
ncbi:MAG: sigma-70 family RNA polymerase sigma factor [Planctomycetaceae bacterium]|nr:sigma-70 family RNA polymerase sigma factor [Planctomycetaceae bacterium]